MDYLTVGTSDIWEDQFLAIQDSSSHRSIKPSGGLWGTRFGEWGYYYNEWVDFLLRHPYLLFYKNKGENIFCQPCALIRLKDEARIFYLDSVEKYFSLVRDYGDQDLRFRFEDLSRDYDGIYVDLYSLYEHVEIMNLFVSFGVNSLILFRSSSIACYWSGKVLIDPFDYEAGAVDGDVSYRIEIESLKKVVGKCKILRKNVKNDEEVV